MLLNHEPLKNHPQVYKSQPNQSPNQLGQHIGNHYFSWQVGDFIQQQNLDFFEGNVVKYVSRHRRKDGAKDIKKAIAYLQRILEMAYPEDADGNQTRGN